ncbi:MAG: hypothetical protein IGS23_14090 [Rivularia sp. T60_A2020_040]|nr:hypothetical protein [Rivularia sp. T60_A2020_040]
MQLLSVLQVVKAVASIVDQLLTIVTSSNVMPNEKIQVVDDIERVKAKLTSIQYHTETDIDDDELV